MIYSSNEGYNDSSQVDFFISNDARVYYPTHIWTNPFPLKATTSTIVRPGERCLIPTGLFFAISVSFAGFVTIASSLADQGFLCVNAPGLIDCQYRGEIKVILQNCNSATPLTIHQGEEIAHMSIRSTISIEMESSICQNK